MKEIIILGSTGSIGTQALDIVDENSDKFKVVGLSCNSKIKELKHQIKTYSPKYVCVSKEKDAIELKKEFYKVEFFVGSLGLFELASLKCDLLLNALMGISGLAPTYNAIKNGVDIALANKETMVTGGKLITDLAKEKNVNILPVDSEHSAIFQCLDGKTAAAERIYLTCSGGPFFGKDREFLKRVTAAEALAHPTWSMGAQITIDSATLMNKGFEVIEAARLFDIPGEDIEVLIHRDSIVHSMVGFYDGAVLAQLSLPDMRLCIQYAVTYPNRIRGITGRLDFTAMKPLCLSRPDTGSFRLLDTA